MEAARRPNPIVPDQMRKILVNTILLIAICSCVYAQSIRNESSQRHLDKLISMNVRNERVSEVLGKMSKAGGFYFSYSGRLFSQDSILSMNTANQPVRDVLDQLFAGKVDYKEFNEHIILRYAAHHFTIEPENITSAEGLYIISGWVVDTQSGARVRQASVYEKRLLPSTLTDQNGYFTLKFKGDHKEVILTASKDNYRDTSLVFLADIKVKPEGYKDSKETAGNFQNGVETSGFSRFFIGSRQRIQSMNIPDFFANMPYQASLVPGLSSHGLMSSQVVNKFSLNLIGGYTAGVNGVELGGVFNISKGAVKKLQVAGLFNVIGGSVEGIQLAGLVNDVRTDVSGVQAAGLFNSVRKKMGGVQIAGLANLVIDTLGGTQAAGLFNVATQAAAGVQIAGIGNIAAKSFSGTQIAGIFNFARDMHGLQIGLINLSENNDGVSIGLINVVRNGYNKISISSNELINANVAYKMGNAKLYNILFAGKNFSKTERLETVGFGFGHDFIFTKRFSIAGEFSSQYLYLGNWDYANYLNRFQGNLQYQFVKGVTIFGGPVYSVYTSDAPVGSSAKGYKQQVYPNKRNDYSDSIKGWFGWNVGITLN